MSEFSYLLDKIKDAEFKTEPFKYLYIQDFFKPEHFDLLTSNEQINTKEVQTTEELIELLDKLGYAPIPFPGCTTSVTEYLDWYNNSTTERISHHLKQVDDLLEGFGMSMRMHTYSSSVIEELITFLNSDSFLNVVMEKFNKSGNLHVETAIQKYLSGYEISPHPDIRKKCLTYMVNINPHKDETLSTHFMQFKSRTKCIEKYWSENPSHERCWVPWDWCETTFQHSKNNSITMFAPDSDTMHAVKLDYDHTKYQRTQIYGNLWYANKPFIDKNLQWKDLNRAFLQR